METSRFDRSSALFFFIYEEKKFVSNEFTVCVVTFMWLLEMRRAELTDRSPRGVQGLQSFSAFHLVLPSQTLLWLHQLTCLIQCCFNQCCCFTVCVRIIHRASLQIPNPPCESNLVSVVRFVLYTSTVVYFTPGKLLSLEISFAQSWFQWSAMKNATLLQTWAAWFNL